MFENNNAIFREGYAAALDGKPSKDNPYTLLALTWWAWVDGYNQGSHAVRKATIKQNQA